MPDPSARRQPPRRPQISREYLEEVRRRRYVDAVAELLHEFARDDLSVTSIVRLAGTARNSFYEVFAGADDCIAYGVGLAVDEIFATLDAQSGEGEWVAEVDEAIAGFYAAVAARPLLAELFLVHAGATRAAHGRDAARAGAERFAALLRRGRTEAEADGRPPLPSIAEEYLSRAIVSLAARRVRDPDVGALPGQARGVTRLVAGFYLDAEDADRILGVPAPRASIS